MNAKQTPRLREFQQRMAGLIVDSERFNTDADARALITVPDDCDAVTRLRVYANGYPARLEESLKETFPAVEHVVGPGAFAALAHQVLVRRAGFAVLCESLESAEALALSLLIEGHTLGNVMATLSDRGDDTASVSTWFGRWAALRMIVSCTC